MGDPFLDGTKSLPPLELGFFSWITNALAAVKATDSTAEFLDATATKKPKLQRGLDIIGRFRVQDALMFVTVTGDDKAGFKISKPDEIATGASVISNPEKLANDPVAIVVNNGKKVQTYTSFRLFRHDPSVLVANKKLVNQPYYEFVDDKKTKLGLFGASDGKDYLGVK